MKTFTKNPLPNLAQIRFPRPRGNCLYVHWCCICSKCAEEDKGNATSTSKSCFIFSCCNPLKGLFTSRKDEPAAVATTMVSSDSGEGVLDAKLKGYGAMSSGVSSLDKREKNRMKKLGLSFDLRRKWNGHHRRATMDGRVKDGRNGTVDGGHGNEVDTSGVGVGEGTNSKHAATGWPGWLTNVAPEAVQGWFPRRADSFEKLDKIGEGTYSTVYKARDLKSGSVVALKKVRFVNMDPDSVRFMAREIHILRRLDHPNVVKLEGIVISCVSHNIYLVFEYMEHDLAGLAATPGLKFTEPQVKCFMQQLLDGLDHCHKNGVLHRDIKGSNLLIDGNGILKIADFGLATSFGADDQQPLTSRVVTLWYRPPELLLDATDYGVAVDMWSTGCILAELLVGKPIMPGRTEVEQIHKIFKLCGSPSDEYWTKAKVPPTTMFRPQHRYRRCVAETFRGFPRSALALLDDLLALEPEARGTAASALQSDFFRTKPLACSPSSLPKFPPSKEYDVRLRQEDARRKRKEAQRSESVRPGNDENPTTHHAANGVTEVKLPTQISTTIKKMEKKIKQPKPIQLSTLFHMSMKHGHKRSKSNSLQLSPEASVLGFHLEAPTLQPPGYESTWNNNTASHNNGHHMVPGRTYNSVRVSNGHALRAHTSLVPQHGAAAAAGSRNARHNRSGTVDRPGFHKEDGVKKPNYGGQNRRVNYSGPLMPPAGGDVDEMLKEHERHIQEAVRKARLDKSREL